VTNPLPSSSHRYPDLTTSSARWVQAFHQVLTIILHASIHQTLLENDAIDYAEETLQSVRRKEQQQFVALPSDASQAANQKFSGVKKKRLPLSSGQQIPPQHLTEASATSSTPSLAMISLTGVLQIDEILPLDEMRRTASAPGHRLERMRSIEEELGAASPLLQRSARAMDALETQSGSREPLLAAAGEEDEEPPPGPEPLVR
jgi:hypothetical protein